MCSISQSPVYHNDLKTPIEIFTGIKPTIDHLKVFGCIGYVRKPAEKLRGSNKLETRAYPCIFIGYGKSRNIYILCDKAVFSLSPGRILKRL
jgi:hypothetical protein